MRTMGEMTAPGVTSGEPGTPDVQGLLTVEAAAKRLGVSRTTVYQLMDSGQLRYVRLPGVRARRIRPEHVDELIERCTTAERQP